MIALFSYRVYLGVRYVVFFCRVLLRNRAFAYSIEYTFPVEIVLVRVVAHALTHGNGGLFCRVCGVHIHHTNILFHEDCPGIFDFFSQAKVPEKYGSQEIQSEETKSEEKRHPACEKHNRANHLLAPYVEARPEGGARAEKEIGEKV